MNTNETGEARPTEAVLVVQVERQSAGTIRDAEQLMAMAEDVAATSLLI
jgi:hypothetical protein